MYLPVFRAIGYASNFDLATKTEDTSVKNAIELVESWIEQRIRREAKKK